MKMKMRMEMKLKIKMQMKMKMKMKIKFDDDVSYLVIKLDSHHFLSVLANNIVPNVTKWTWFF